MTLRNHSGLLAFVALGLLVSGCGDDGGSDSGSDSGTAADEIGTSTDAGTEAGDTVDTSATTTAESTDAGTDAGTDAETTDAGTTDAETTAAETTAADTTTDATTGDSPCTALETADECTAMAGCQVVNGSKLKQNGPNSPCLEPSGFLGCIAEAACGDAISWFCQGNAMFQVNDTCGPDGAEPCDAPADPVADCP